MRRARLWWLAVLVTLIGCASPTPRDELLLELTVRAATSRVLHERPAWRPEVVRIAGGGLLLLAGDETAALGALESYVVEEIPWSQLTPEEQALARVAIGAIRETVVQYLADRGVSAPEEVRVRVRQVLGWIEETARLGAPS